MKIVAVRLAFISHLFEGDTTSYRVAFRANSLRLKIVNHTRTVDIYEKYLLIIYTYETNIRRTANDKILVFRLGFQIRSK